MCSHFSTVSKTLNRVSLTTSDLWVKVPWCIHSGASHFHGSLFSDRSLHSYILLSYISRVSPKSLIFTTNSSLTLDITQHKLIVKFLENQLWRWWASIQSCMIIPESFEAFFVAGSYCQVYSIWSVLSKHNLDFICFFTL